MAARGPSKQFKFSVPESDERLISWLEAQQNLSVSMSWLNHLSIVQVVY